MNSSAHYILSSMFESDKTIPNGLHFETEVMTSREYGKKRKEGTHKEEKC